MANGNRSRNRRTNSSDSREWQRLSAPDRIAAAFESLQWRRYRRWIAMDWSALQQAFESNFSHGDELGAAVAVWCARSDRPLLSLHEGWTDRSRARRWSPETLCPIWSATKGPAAWCLLQALRDQGMSPAMPLAELWPRLGAARVGGNEVTLADVLHHRLGLPALEAPVDGLDHEAVRRALELQSPEWKPGTAQGYHPRTFGWLLDELVRRVSGADSLTDFWNQRIRQRFDLETWIGLPLREHPRVAGVIPGKWTAQHGDDPLYGRMSDASSLQARAFRSPAVAARVADISRPEILAAGLAAFGGVSTAEALARFYAKLSVAGDPGGNRSISLAGYSNELPDSTADEDLVLLRPLAFRGGFMAGHGGATPYNSAGPVFGRDLRRFGYPGAGGVLAFADPTRRLGFAYVMNQMELQVLPGTKARRLVGGYDNALAAAGDAVTARTL